MTNTESILSEIDELKQIALSDLDKLHADDDQLENWRISYLGRNGKLSSLMKILATIPNDDKRLVGPKINDLKEDLSYPFFYVFDVDYKNVSIKVFFDKKNLDLIGWETTDIYQNIVQTFISDIQKNVVIDNKIFLIQRYIN